MNKLRLIICELNNGKSDKLITFNDYDYNCIKNAYKVLDLIVLEIQGKTYTEKRKAAQNLAIDFDLFRNQETDIDLSIPDYSTVENYFKKIGKRYGLTQEFKENAVI